ncbi:MAG: hypothetical protein R3325_06375 [Thermoanaerobaculia bacterium]|nr:hypothetical protein [Thermoanaerobaculia bacterium]
MGEVRGEIVSDDGVLVIRSIRVVYRLKTAEEHHDAARRVLGFHARFCPVARTLAPGVEIATELELV